MRTVLKSRRSFGPVLIAHQQEELRAALFDWADWHDNFRIHSTLGYMSPVEFREAASASRRRSRAG